MNAYRYAFPLFVALAGAAVACSSDDDDDNTELNQGGSGGSAQGAGGTGPTQGAGGAGGAAGTAGGGGSGGGTSQGGAGACGTPEAELAAAPAAIKAIVDERQNMPPDGMNSTIVRYDYNGEGVESVNTIVYYVPPPPMTSDATSQVLDQSGTLICEPEGGLMGNGDGRCDDFAERRSNACVVWAGGRTAQ